MRAAPPALGHSAQTSRHRESTDFLDPNILIAFLTLTALELVLGIDNIIFISILAGRLPEAERPKARYIGLFLGMFMRIGLLYLIIGLTEPL